MLPRFGGSLESVRSETQVAYSLPAHASAGIVEFLRPFSMGEVSPGFLARLPGGRVFGSGNVLSPDGELIARDVSPDFGKKFAEHWLLTFKKIRAPAWVAGPVAVVATTLGTGYSHWLLEELPRLLMLRPDGADVLIGHGAAYGREALRLHGFSGRLIEAEREAHFACGQLIIPRVPGEAGQPTPSVINRLVEFTAPLHAETSIFGERLYISRENARRRRVANESVLWSQLEARGFRRIHLENLSWSEQINAFRHAKVIVAPHGAGLANLAFCRPQTQVVEFFHRSYLNPCFWRLAALRGLDYRPIASQGSQVLAYEQSAGRLDIEADVSTILDALS
ncbi:MAG TPA: glycosyltransferase family 61 protein [Rariglobus sp.]|jgi:capsular polysaccharide biosynthesis protein|nr:glycosyltransferase family 61 protein [Rariglobus sp.]